MSLTKSNLLPDFLSNFCVNFLYIKDVTRPTYINLLLLLDYEDQNGKLNINRFPTHNNLLP